MRVFVFVNKIEEINERQTTAILIAELLNQKYQVFISNVESLSCSMNSRSPVFITSGTFLNPKVTQSPVTSKQIESIAARTSDSVQELVELTPKDTIFIRTNPGRDQSRWKTHDTFLTLCKLASSNSIRVINDPRSLCFYANKSAISELPEKYRPKSFVSNDADSIVNFINELSCDCVVKPLIGSRGQSVFKFNKNTTDIRNKILKECENGHLIAQEFVSSTEPGDKRVIVLDGYILEVDGNIAGIQRLPAEGDFRSNLHAGGMPKYLTLNDQEREAAHTSAELLFGNGIKLAGIDLIGGKVIEFNVFSTGGLYHCQNLTGTVFSSTIINSLFGKP